MDPTSNNNNTGYGNSGAAGATPNNTGFSGTSGATTNPIIQPTNPVVQPTNSNANSFSATDPIMQPEPAAKPDPVAAELSEPMKAAAPAPGSIGSAVSGPATDSMLDDSVIETPANTTGTPANTTGTPANTTGAPANTTGAPINAAGANAADVMKDKQTPSVAFNDPAAQPDQPAPGVDPNAEKKKKTNRTTLIILIVVAIMIILGLLAVLIFQLTSGSGTAKTSTASTAANTEYEPDEDDEELSGFTLSCSREATATELAEYTNSVSGRVAVEADFDSDKELETISLARYIDIVTTEDSETTATAEDENEALEDSAAGTNDSTIAADIIDINATNADEFELPLDDEGEVVVDLDKIQANYETLGYTCETL